MTDKIYIIEELKTRVKFLEVRVIGESAKLWKVDPETGKDLMENRDSWARQQYHKEDRMVFDDILKALAYALGIMHRKRKALEEGEELLNQVAENIAKSFPGWGTEQ